MLRFRLRRLLLVDHLSDDRLLRWAISDCRTGPPGARSRRRRAAISRGDRSRRNPGDGAARGSRTRLSTREQSPRRQAGHRRGGWTIRAVPHPRIDLRARRLNRQWLCPYLSTVASNGTRLRATRGSGSRLRRRSAIPSPSTSNAVGTAACAQSLALPSDARIAAQDRPRRGERCFRG